MVDEQQILENMDLVYFILHKYYPNFVKNEDVVQSGMLGLCRASETFDETYGIKFSTYAGKCIRNAINNEIAKMKRKSKEFSFDFNYEDDEDGNKWNMLQYFEVEDEDVIEDVHIENFIKKLTEREKIVFDYRMMGYSYNDISKMTGYGTHQNIQLICKKIQTKWRRHNGKP